MCCTFLYHNLNTCKSQSMHIVSVLCNPSRYCCQLFCVAGNRCTSRTLFYLLKIRFSAVFYLCRFILTAFILQKPDLLFDHNILLISCDSFNNFVSYVSKRCHIIYIIFPVTVSAYHSYSY